MVYRETYKLKHCTNSTHSVFQITIHSQTAAIHSLPNIPPFYPSLIIPESPSLAAVYLPAFWLHVRMAIGMNDCSLTPWNLKSVASMSLLSNSGVSGCILSAKIVLGLFVTNTVIDDELCLCFLAFAPPPHLPSWCSCGVCVCLVWMRSHHSK